MRGRSTNFEYLGVEILKVLEEASVPMSALGINFAINSKLDRIVELNTVKTHLSTLVKSRKLTTKMRDNITLYRLQ